MRSTFKKAAGVGVLAASIITIGTVASAAGPEPTVNACVGKVTGFVRIIDPAKQSCSGLEKPLSWNQRGSPDLLDLSGLPELPDRRGRRGATTSSGRGCGRVMARMVATRSPLLLRSTPPASASRVNTCTTG